MGAELSQGLPLWKNSILSVFFVFLFFFFKIKEKCLTCISSEGITVPYLKNPGQLSLFLQSQHKNLSLGNGEAGTYCRSEKSFSVETKENN